ncbi:UDP-N-acetylmuramate dehydrogenase [Desulfofustis limnaeus]|uniref:UDP-N-acetylenolpyruvoylglucosamine reductase n=1 Tax=Desulfofustis limnaeus TaxID=2740163 RepID=A0ABM7W653_9BACT|nr:UDP-N-acetylmuramate dehydrogenase [Desulfofustis limnaeus]MDX9893921.1 UDP-N-acetylmuramate dehydrogenase [Desulfofustis sp.]BDD86363.1 UDP-N-acetylenolpyruvoylglucosamine reductase [Desulfofustis limnaeus]
MKGLSSSQKAALTGVVGSGSIRWNEPLSSWTTYRVGGPADALVTLLAVQELPRLLTVCCQQGIRWRALGRGSNILAADDGFRGVIIVLDGEFKYIVRQRQEGSRVLVKTGAAVSLPHLSGWCGDEGYGGLEFAVGIPGSVAGAVMMNAGAWGGEISQVVVAVELVGPDGVHLEQAGDLRFGYRCCHALRGQRQQRVISAVQFLLNDAEPEIVKKKMRDFRERRNSSQPVGQASGGCVFKNPPGLSAGRLIDEAGLKGLRIGDAMVSDVHANFLVNCGRARALEIAQLIEVVRARVMAATGVLLETELELLAAEGGP